jgi:adenylate cyclase
MMLISFFYVTLVIPSKYQKNKMRLSISRKQHTKNILQDNIQKNDETKEVPGNIPSDQPSLDDAVLLVENKISDYVTAVDEAKFFCVGIIDIVNSTKTVSKLSQKKSSRYYELFLNTMAKSLHRFNTQILKTMGDSLLFYFPETCFAERKFGFLTCLESGFSLKDSYIELNRHLEEEGLPKIDFRISFDYGYLTIMKDMENRIDLVGPTINTCSKINSLCPINDMIIGGDLYEKTKNFEEYKIKKIDSYSIDLKHSYPVYSVNRKIKSV